MVISREALMPREPALNRLDADGGGICTVKRIATVPGCPWIFRPGFDIAQTRRELVGTVIREADWRAGAVTRGWK
jgi:hypothetical protein